MLLLRSRQSISNMKHFTANKNLMWLKNHIVFVFEKKPLNTLWNSRFSSLENPYFKVTQILNHLVFRLDLYSTLNIFFIWFVCLFVFSFSKPTVRGQVIVQVDMSASCLNNLKSTVILRNNFLVTKATVYSLNSVGKQS